MWETLQGTASQPSHPSSQHTSLGRSASWTVQVAELSSGPQVSAQERSQQPGKPAHTSAFTQDYTQQGTCLRRL